MLDRFSRTVKLGSALVILAVGLSAPGTSTIAAPSPMAPANRPLYVTQAPIVMLKDMESGAILFSRGANKQFAPASMAKVMTAYVVLDMIKTGQLSRDARFTMTEAIWKKWNGSKGGSTMFLRAGEKVSVDELLKGLIAVSGNDAAALLAVGIDASEEEFIKRMNRVAARIGMKSSHFGTPNGWPDGGRTRVTAGDLMILADRVLSEHPEAYRRYFSISKLQHGTSPDGKPIVQPNRNPLLGRFQGADGLKTGYTAEAGYCLMGSAARKGRRLVMVVAGMGSERARREEAERLLQWGFEEWEGRALVPANRKLGKVEVNRGSEPVVAAATANPVRVTVPAGHKGGFRAVVRAMSPVGAPVQRGTPIAQLVVTPAGLPSQVTTLVAANDVEQGGIWAQTRAGFYRLTGL